METATDGTLGNFEVRPRLRPTGMQFFKRLFHEMQGSSRRVRLEVSPGSVAFNGIAPLRNLPLELDLGKRSRLRQIDLYAVTGSLDVANVHDASERRSPEAGDRTAAGIERKMVSRALVEPPR